MSQNRAYIEEFDLSDTALPEAPAPEPRGVSTVCGWCMGAVGASGECERGCDQHERGRE